MERFKKQFPQCDGFVISKPADMRYLAGFETADALLLWSDEPKLISDHRYEVAMKAARVPAVMAPGSYVDTLIELAKAQGLKTLGIQEEQLPTETYLKLADAGFTLVQTGDWTQKNRAVKTAEEIASIKAAQAITDKAFTAILDDIKPGVTEKQIRAKLEYYMFAFGADGIAFDTIIASGANGAKPHAVPSDKPVENGEFITMDFGARKNGYDADMTRTVALGSITPEMERIYHAVLEAHIAGTEALKPGVTGKAADQAARDVLAKHELAQYFTHSLGHGVGIEIHEKPNLSQKSDAVLAEGHIVTIEPGVYLEGFCGVRIENMAVLTRDGCEVLTGSDKNLIKL